MSYVHDDQHGSLLGRGVRDRAVLVGCRVDLPTMSMGAWTDWHAVVMDDPEEAVSVLREQDQAIERLTAENAALKAERAELVSAGYAGKLQRQLDALRAAAGKVQCFHCGNLISEAWTRLGPCPSCADLRKLLGEKP